MDFGLYSRVLWRFRLLMLAGVLLGLCLALFSYVRVSFDGGRPVFQYRQSEVWQSEARLLVTQKGFHWGRIAPTYRRSDPEDDVPAVPESDPVRLSNNATLFAQFAAGDFVQAIVGPAMAPLVAFEPVPAPPLSSPPILPIISVRALGPTPPASQALARRAADALMAFVRREQDRAQIPEAERVRVEILASPKRPVLIAPRGKTVPVIVFVAVLMAAAGLAFILENLRPRLKKVSDESSVEDRAARAEAPLRSA